MIEKAIQHLSAIKPNLLSCGKKNLKDTYNKIYITFEKKR